MKIFHNSQLLLFELGQMQHEKGFYQNPRNFSTVTGQKQADLRKAISMADYSNWFKNISTFAHRKQIR